MGEGPAIHRSVLLYVATAAAASVNGTEYVVGTITSGTHTARGVLRLLAAPGGAGNNTLDVKIQHDTTGFASPTDAITFTQLDQASVALSEVGTYTTGTTDTFWRIVTTYAGAGSRTFSVVIGFGIYLT